MQLPKFEILEADLALDDPRFSIMAGWALMNSLHQENFDFVIQPIYRDLYSPEDRERLRDPSFSYAVELEARIGRELPELGTAIDELRSALDKVTGWHVSWRHYERGEVIGQGAVYPVEIEGVDNPAVVIEVVRGPAQYHLNEGWVVNSIVGADRLTRVLNVWLEIGTDRESTRGLNFMLGDMHAIEFTPPAQ